MLMKNDGFLACQNSSTVGSENSLFNVPDRLKSNNNPVAFSKTGEICKGAS
jgi:hypothetical protein